MAAAMLIKMASIQVTWIVLALLFIGLGAALHRALRIREPTELGACFFTGWAITLGLLQILQLFLPCRSVAVTFGIVGLGVASLVWNRRSLMAATAARWHDERALFIAIASFAIVLSNHALGPLRTVDAGLYHLSAIRWAWEHPIVTGLGNLHGRLAFNSAWFTQLAWLDATQWISLRGYQVGAWLLLIALAARLLDAARDIRSPELVTRHRAVFAGLLLLPLLHVGLLLHIAATSPDPVILIVGIAIALELHRMLFEQSTRASFFTIALLSTVGVSIKLSFAAVAGASLAIAAVALIRSPDGRLDGVARSLAPGLLAAALILVPWGVRGVALSGYPAYPSTFFAVDVPWRVPPERAEAEVRWIRSWARWPGRTPERVLGNRDWLRPWLGRLVRNVDGVALVVLPGVLVVAGGLGSIAASTALRRRAALLALPSVLGALFWLGVAPDPRFLGSALWCVGAAAIATAVTPDDVTRQRGAPLRAIAIGGAALVALASLCFDGYMGWGTHSLVITPGPAAGAHPLPIPATKPFRTDTGLILHTPAEGSQCWDAPLPCTPYPAKRLGVRDPGDIGSGFELQ